MGGRGVKIYAQFEFSDLSTNDCGYRFECEIPAVPRVGETLVLPSTNPFSKDIVRGDQTSTHAKVTGVCWVPMQHGDGPNVIVHAEMIWRPVACSR